MASGVVEPLSAEEVAELRGTFADLHAQALHAKSLALQATGELDVRTAVDECLLVMVSRNSLSLATSLTLLIVQA
jgi:hypothetical protein